MIMNDLQDFSNNIQKPCRLLGIDYGRKKLGIAVSNIEQTMALPLQLINEERLHLRLAELAKIIQTHEIKGLIIGLPLNMDGSFGEQALEVQKFAEKLIEAFALPAYLQDERLTTRAANNTLKAAGFTRKERDSLDDQIAACMILETSLMRLQRMK